MKRIIFIPLILFLVLSACTKTDEVNPQFTKLEHQQSIPENNYQKQLYKYLDRLRESPQVFYTEIAKDYIQKYNHRFTEEYTESLKQDLLKLKALPSLKKSALLFPIAKRQLNYLVYDLEGKRLEHNQGNQNMYQRMQGSGLTSFSENLYRAKNSSALDVIMDLLIDQNIPGLGHRKNMLASGFNLVKIVSDTAKNGYVVTVMDFGRD